MYVDPTVLTAAAASSKEEEKAEEASEEKSEEEEEESDKEVGQGRYLRCYCGAARASWLEHPGCWSKVHPVM